MMYLLLRKYELIYFLTLRAQNWLGNNLIYSPFAFIFKSIGVSNQRLNEVKKWTYIPEDKPERGHIYGLSGYFMLPWIFLSLLILDFLTNKQQIEGVFDIIFWGLLLINVIFHYFLFFHKDRNIEIIKKLKTTKAGSIDIFLTIIFNMIPFVLIIYSLLKIKN
jgi:hypothetical protein